jgi:hypothetical protein
MSNEPETVQNPKIRSLRASGLLSSILNCFHNVLITSATTEIAFQSMPYFVTRWLGFAVEQLCGSYDHARRAKPTLQTMTLPKSLLHWMQVSVGCETLDGGDICTVCLNGKYGA